MEPRWLSWDMGASGERHLTLHEPGTSKAARLWVCCLVRDIHTGHGVAVMVGKTVWGLIEELNGAPFTLQREGSGLHTRFTVTPL